MLWLFLNVDPGPWVSRVNHATRILTKHFCFCRNTPSPVGIAILGIPVHYAHYFFFPFHQKLLFQQGCNFFLFHCYLNVFIQSVSSPLDTTQMQQWYVSPTQLLICESNEMHTRAPYQMGWMQSSGLAE